ncbi:MAG: hypothetical protein IPP35_03085 [Elusimicrobia bacterium]|nr:hypothetical protein [Elusimicrobiota bacterium]
MTNPPNAPHSRWVRPSPIYSLSAFLAAIGVLTFRWALGPWMAVSLALLAIPYCLWVLGRGTLYPHIYRARWLASLGLLLSFMGFSDAAGRLAYQGLWRRAFQLGGNDALFQEDREGWSVHYPGLWKPYDARTNGATTFLFKPNRLTPAMEFSVTRRALPAKTNLETAGLNFLLALPKSGSTKILTQRSIPYPGAPGAYEVVYEDPDQLILLRHRLIFLLNGGDMFVLSVVAVPVWMERLSAESERFLFSFRQTT